MLKCVNQISPTPLHHHHQPEPLIKTSSISVDLLFLRWLNPLFRIGSKRRLDEDDIFEVLPEDRSEHLGEELKRFWDQEVINASKEMQTPSLAKAMIRCYWKSYSVLGFFNLFERKKLWLLLASLQR
uniref:Uncharacterized protein n=1 Tax=Oryzias latipes TaxID=8090 RepID=A0A3P9JLT5_ORYLA